MRLHSVTKTIRLLSRWVKDRITGRSIISRDPDRKLTFKNLKIFRPSLLIGYRDEFRILEEIAKFFSAILSFFMIGAKNRLWTIRGTEVALAMYRVARKQEPGVEKFKPHRMIQLAA